MDKRYQVFVSSTYADLKQEREHVIRTLMEMDCIPAGMDIGLLISLVQPIIVEGVILKLLLAALVIAVGGASGQLDVAIDSSNFII